jgi:hypothetical protein
MEAKVRTDAKGKEGDCFLEVLFAFVNIHQSS